MLIKITQKDIEQGYPCECRGCPISLAAERAGMIDPIVTNDYITELHKSYILPQVAQKFIDDFDAGVKVQPFEFEIERE